jgi:hypothetical protein
MAASADRSIEQNQMPAGDQANQNGATVGMGGIAAPDRTEDTTALITEQCCAPPLSATCTPSPFRSLSIVASSVSRS